VVAPARNSARLDSRGEGPALVSLDGEQDVTTVSVLAVALTRAIARDDADPTVDVSGVKFLGAATINVWIRGRNLLRRRARNLTLRFPSRCARQVLALRGLVAPFDRTQAEEGPGLCSGAPAPASWVDVPATARPRQAIEPLSQGAVASSDSVFVERVTSAKPRQFVDAERPSPMQPIPSAADQGPG
jgi:anti-anti-sigma regulatory factor